MIKKIVLKRELLLLMALLAVLTMTITPALAASAWQPVGSPDFTGASPAGESLFVYNGTPYVLYSDASNRITVMEYTGGSWQTVGSPDFATSASGCSLFVDNGTPYVACSVFGDATYKAAVMEYTGGSWQYVGSPDFSSGMTSGESLYVYNGTPYVAYEDIKNLLNQYNGPVTVMEYPVIKVDINGSPLQMDIEPQIVDGRTLAPLRAIFEALGATVQWDPADQSISATKGNTTIKLQIGSTTALNNGAPVTLDAAPMIVNGRTLVPVRFIGEALGAQVSWDAANYQVNIVTASP
jgi:hypothetical protein